MARVWCAGRGATLDSNPWGAGLTKVQKKLATAVQTTARETLLRALSPEERASLLELLLRQRPGAQGQETKRSQVALALAQDALRPDANKRLGLRLALARIETSHGRGSACDVASR